MRQNFVCLLAQHLPDVVGDNRKIAQILIQTTDSEMIPVEYGCVCRGAGDWH